MSIRAADESTEVLLADYLEGKLPPERARDIDAYLAAHPKERVVLEQLRTQPGLLARLPGERAPGDVLEAVQGQLERSVLLESMSELESRPKGPRRHWPQPLATAALLLLTAGLGLVVYKIVVPSGPGGLASSGNGYTVPAHPAEHARRSGEGAGEGTGGAGDRVASVFPTPTESAAAPADAGAGVALDDAAAGEERPAGRVTLYAADPAATRGRVEAFLRAGGWSYITTPAAGPGGGPGGGPVAKAEAAPTAATQEVTAVELRADAVRGRGGHGPSEGDSPARGQVVPGEPEAGASAGSGPTSRTTPAEPATRPAEAGPELLLVRVEAEQIESLTAALLRVGATVTSAGNEANYRTTATPAVPAAPKPTAAAPATPAGVAPQAAGGGRDGVAPRLVNLLVVIRGTPAETPQAHSPATLPTTVPATLPVTRPTTEPTTRTGG